MQNLINLKRLFWKKQEEFSGHAFRKICFINPKLLDWKLCEGGKGIINVVKTCFFARKSLKFDQKSRIDYLKVMKVV